MKTRRILYFILLFHIVLSFMGCAKLGIIKNDVSEIEKYINEDVKVLGELPEKYTFADSSNDINGRSVHTEYKDLSGVVDILNIYASEKGSRAYVKYNSDFKEGEIRVVLIDSNNEAVDITRENGEGTTEVNIAGRSRVRLIGNKATGSLKIDVVFGELPTESSLPITQFNEDGIFLLSDCKINDNNFEGSLFRILVVNKQVEMMAQVKLKGVLEDGKGTFQFDDDGWGNSGYVDFEYLGENKNQFTVVITKRENQDAEWGIEEGVITSNEEPVPDYLNGL